MSFEALPSDGAVELSWRTGSEVDNLGFHLHRAPSAEGPWARLTSSMLDWGHMAVRLSGTALTVVAASVSGTALTVVAGSVSGTALTVVAGSVSGTESTGDCESSS